MKKTMTVVFVLGLAASAAAQDRAGFSSVKLVLDPLTDVWTVYAEASVIKGSYVTVLNFDCAIARSLTVSTYVAPADPRGPLMARTIEGVTPGSKVGRVRVDDGAVKEMLMMLKAGYMHNVLDVSGILDGEMPRERLVIADVHSGEADVFPFDQKALAVGERGILSRCFK